MRTSDSAKQCAPRSIVALTLLSAFALCGCKPGAPAPSATPPAATSAAHSSAAPAKKEHFVVYATFYPLAYFAERIGGTHVQVVNPCPADADCSFWMPSADIVRQYQSADLILINGAQYERWVDKAALPPSALVDTTKEFASEFIVMPKAIAHSHGPSGMHTHEGVDGHTWLDPVNAKRQAEAILEGLSARFPAPAEEFEANFEKLAADLDKLGARAANITPYLTGQILAAAHPAYNYLARRYEWQVRNFALDPAGKPGGPEWETLRGSLSAEPVPLMLWEEQPNDDMQKMLLEDLGITSVVFSPVESLSPEEKAKGEDYFTLMNANFDRLEAAIGTGGPPVDTP